MVMPLLAGRSTRIRLRSRLPIGTLSWSDALTKRFVPRPSMPTRMANLGVSATHVLRRWLVDQGLPGPTVQLHHRPPDPRPLPGSDPVAEPVLLPDLPVLHLERPDPAVRIPSDEVRCVAADPGDPERHRLVFEPDDFAACL